MPGTASRKRQRQSLRAGPWIGVRNTLDPFDGDPRELLDAVNMWIPDPATGSGASQRPGFALLNEDPLGTTPFIGQGVYTHYDVADPFNPAGPGGGAYRFCVFGGKIYRADATLTTFTDVTPGTVTIDPSARVYFASLNGALIVSDGVHRPWTTHFPQATPLAVATYIDVDGSGTDWSAFGQPVVYGGALFFILQEFGAIAAQISITWSEPNDAETGYFQAPTFDNLWTLEQTGTSLIYALAATNVALYYFREQSIGTISGVVGPELEANATHDAIAWNVGTRSPQTVQQFGDIIYFCDVVGRPYRMVQGNAPEPIWQQLRAVIDAAQFGFPAVTQRVACAVVDPSLNLYLAAIWSYRPSSNDAPIEIQAFDARTGKYVGRWQLAGGTGDGDGIFIDAMGIWFDDEGRATTIMQGSDIGPATGIPVHGFLWGMNGLAQVGQTLAEEDTSDWLAEEDGVTLLAVEGNGQTWLDDADPPYVDVLTLPLGYTDDTIWTADTATVITGTSTACAVEVTTPTALNAVEGSPSPASSLDDTYRLMCGLDAIQGRGISVRVIPALTADTPQWVIQRVVVVATPSLAGHEEP